MKLLILKDMSVKKDYSKIFEIIKNLAHDLVAFIRMDNDNNFDKIEGYDVYPFAYIQILDYDLALIDGHVGAIQPIIPQLVSVGIPQNKIKSIYWLLQQIMIEKYEHIQDSAIHETLEYWKTHEMTPFNQHLNSYPDTFHEVFTDETCGLPYIIFQTVEGKNRRMYYPPGSGTKFPDGKTYITNIFQEQVPTSPHLYIKDNHKINDGDILIDAGVCEGNFALRYVDICSKVYLFEMDKKWFAPLYFSFRDCWNKIEFIPKAVSGNNLKWGG